MPLPLPMLLCFSCLELSYALTVLASQLTLMSLWHFLWMSNLHCVHLKPCRPRPQMRSLQNAQKALCETTEKVNVVDPTTQPNQSVSLYTNDFLSAIVVLAHTYRASVHSLTLLNLLAWKMCPLTL